MGIKNLFNLLVQCTTCTDEHWSLVRYSLSLIKNRPFLSIKEYLVVIENILLFFRKKLTFRSRRRCSRKSIQCPVWCGDPRGRCQSGYHLMKTIGIIGQHLWICIITFFNKRSTLTWLFSCSLWINSRAIKIFTFSWQDLTLLRVKVVLFFFRKSISS